MALMSYKTKTNPIVARMVVRVASVTRLDICIHFSSASANRTTTLMRRIMTKSISAVVKLSQVKNNTPLKHELICDEHEMMHENRRVICKVINTLRTVILNICWHNPQDVKAVSSATGVPTGAVFPLRRYIPSGCAFPRARD